jgi:hypothetical protein
VLEVRVPKTETAKLRRIEIKNGESGEQHAIEGRAEERESIAA